MINRNICLTALALILIVSIFAYVPIEIEDDRVSNSIAISTQNSSSQYFSIKDSKQNLKTSNELITETKNPFSVSQDTFNNQIEEIKFAKIVKKQSVLKESKDTSEQKSEKKEESKNKEANFVVSTEAEEPKEILFQTKTEETQQHTMDQNLPTEDELLKDSVFDKKFPNVYRYELNTHFLYGQLLNSSISSEFTEKIVDIIETDLQGNSSFGTNLLFVICSEIICLIEYEHIHKEGSQRYNIQRGTMDKLGYKVRVPHGILLGTFPASDGSELEFNTLIVMYQKPHHP